LGALVFLIAAVPSRAGGYDDDFNYALGEKSFRVSMSYHMPQDEGWGDVYSLGCLGLDARFEMIMGGHVGFELGAGGYYSSGETLQRPSGSADSTTLTLYPLSMGILGKYSIAQWRPYGGVGAAYVRWSEDISGGRSFSGTEWAYYLVAGVDYLVHGPYSAFAEVRYSFLEVEAEGTGTGGAEVDLGGPAFGFGFTYCFNR
jgi:outer membrane protein W